MGENHGEPSTSMPKLNIHGKNCVVGADVRTVLYDLLKRNETINAESYQQQFINMNSIMKEKVRICQEIR